MTYASMMTVLSHAEQDREMLARVARFALAQDAHLDVICVGVDRTETGYYYAGANALITQEVRAQAEREVQATEAMAREVLEVSGVRWSVETLVAPLAAVGHAVSLRARYADLVVLPQPYGSHSGTEDVAILEGVLFDADAAVLVVPDTWQPDTPLSGIVVGWNSSSEAMAGIRAAMPFLTEAELVSVAVIDPPQHGPERSDAGGALSQMLSRHGVQAEINVLARTMPRISDIMCRHVADKAADMVVMGAYGHSRFREAILGGATRDMLEVCTVPVLMAH